MTFELMVMNYENFKKSWDLTLLIVKCMIKQSK